MLTLEDRLRMLLDRRAKKRDDVFSGAVPTYEQFLQARGADAEITEQIEAVTQELRGKDEDDL